MKVGRPPKPKKGLPEAGVASRRAWTELDAAKKEELRSGFTFTYGIDGEGQTLTASSVSVEHGVRPATPNDAEYMPTRVIVIPDGTLTIKLAGVRDVQRISEPADVLFEPSPDAGAFANEIERKR